MAGVYVSPARAVFRAVVEPLTVTVAVPLAPPATVRPVVASDTVPLVAVKVTVSVALSASLTLTPATARVPSSATVSGPGTALTGASFTGVTAMANVAGASVFVPSETVNVNPSAVVSDPSWA